MFYFSKKSTKYNNHLPIDLDTIPLNDRKQALKEFAEGSLGLENCLKEMWQCGLKTHACCANELSDDRPSYIQMDVNVDLFSYLSKDTILNDFIKLEVNYDRQIIRFFGPRSIRERLMNIVASDIAYGIKANYSLLQEKVNAKVTCSIDELNKTFMYLLEKTGYKTILIDYIALGKKTGEMVKNDNFNEINIAMKSYMIELFKLNKRLMKSFYSYNYIENASLCKKCNGI